MTDRTGLFVGWYDVDPTLVPEINVWHSSEHMPERYHLPGFKTAQRYQSLDRDNAYCVLYRADRPEVFTSEAYLNILNNPTPWTQRMMPGLLNLNRTLCQVEFSVGSQGCGAHLATIRPADQSDPVEPDFAQLKNVLTENVASHPGFARLEFAVADHGATTRKTNEKQLRRTPDKMSDWVLLVECYGDETVASKLTRVAIDALRHSGLRDTLFDVGHYRLDHALF